MVTLSLRRVREAISQHHRSPSSVPSVQVSVALVLTDYSPTEELSEEDQGLKNELEMLVERLKVRC